MKEKGLALTGLAVVAGLLFVGILVLAASGHQAEALLGSLPMVFGAALAADRNTSRRDGDIVTLGVAGTKKIYAGALVAVDANGYATPGATATTIKGLGRAEAQVDNSSGANGDVSVDVRKGVFKFANDGTDTVTDANIGSDCYIVDDQTVASNDGTGTRSVAGKVFKVDSDGVWVKFD